MISHQHRCIFIHVPKTAGKSVLGLFGLPELGKDYRGHLNHIEDPYDHIPITRYVAQPYYEQYFKFAFVRNPWDRLVSAFHYLDRGGSNPLDQRFRAEHLAEFEGDFPSFVRALPRFLKSKHFCPQLRYVGDGSGNVLLDYVGRFEQLEEGLGEIAARTGVDVSGLGHLNRSQHARYTQYYDDETRQLVANAYARDIRTFGYDFGD